MNESNRVERQLEEISLLEAIYPTEFNWLQNDPSKVLPSQALNPQTQ